jgi:hypothetical protein
MKNTQAFARIMIVGLGIYTCLRTVPLLLNSSAFLLSGPSITSIGMALLSLGVTGTFLGLVIYLLFYKSVDLATHLSRDLDPMPEQPIAAWLPTVLRLICMGTGLLYLSKFVTGLSHALQFWAWIHNQPGVSGNQRPSLTATSFGWALLLPLGIYLIYGAPHYVRWQVRQTLAYGQTQEE